MRMIQAPSYLSMKLPNHPLSYVSSYGVAPAAFPHNTLNFSRVEHLYPQIRSTSVCPQAVIYSTNYFNPFFTFFCCSRSSLYVCTFLSISVFNITQRDFTVNRNSPYRVLKNSLILIHFSFSTYINYPTQLDSWYQSLSKLKLYVVHISK